MILRLAFEGVHVELPLDAAVGEGILEFFLCSSQLLLRVGQAFFEIMVCGNIFTVTLVEIGNIFTVTLVEISHLLLGLENYLTMGLVGLV